MKKCNNCTLRIKITKRKKEIYYCLLWGKWTKNLSMCGYFHEGEPILERLDRLEKQRENEFSR